MLDLAAIYAAAYTAAVLGLAIGFFPRREFI